ncbi:hypothetical protein SAMN04488107_1966 [Geodermatophilus saharensis]|uniref:Uncharacterized protein n=1 Tax=Geodermatophilus saharensis TaxID=1137994 RepID=A0A239D398_9ACTN|nr:hypothetical protein [Geodermatophilus saharensis]SNS26689.1 hypothetical protein SAMN04488107_1966 [Geodermatophilus saharensis]
MLRITVDVFSGRQNPVAEVGDDREARALLREVQGLTTSLADADPGGGLGPRGFLLETLGDDVAVDPSAGATSYLSLSALGAADRGTEIAERLLSLVETGRAPVDAPDAATLDTDLRDHLLAQLAGGGAESVTDQVAAASVAAPAEPADVTCTIELGVFNPGFWNDDATVRLNNNCYNYASNWRTDTFAQPGRGCGRMYTAITCPEVTRAALCDGVHRRFDCFPDSEKPRYLVALVVAPGPGFVDYHWFRKQSGGFWGHKPGGTAARNTDNSGVLITNPETANRGPYTQFCGYFYGCDSQRRRIR